jgi:membrane protein
MGRINWKGIKQVFKDSYNGFTDHKVTKLSGSLAYSTVFSMAPLLIVIISLCSIFLGREAVEGKVYEQLAGFVGSNTAAQLQQIIKSAAINGKSGMAVIIGSLTLLVGSTAVFSEIQDSINTIWGVKPKPKKGWLKVLKNRFLSFSIIVALVFLLLVSLAVSSVIDVFSDHLKFNFPKLTVVALYVINNLVTLAITTIIFAVIFKVLPDAIIKWKDIFVGALCTALFFMIGKLAISLYISKQHIGTTYGAAGSLVVLLVWIYYSSLILFIGAEITKAYALIFGSSIYPKHYAVTTKTVELDTGKKPV